MPGTEQNFDVVIIGGGPAGLSAALWCSDLGMSPVVLEQKAELGGQLLSIYNSIENYPGRETTNGREMRDIFLSQVEARQIKLRTGTCVSEIDFQNCSIFAADGSVWHAKAVVIATGVRRRRLNVKGETDFYGMGIIESGQRDKDFVKGKRLLIVGGGDAALENAILLADLASSVTVIVRKNRFTARPEFVERLNGNMRINVMFDSAVTEFAGDEMLSAVSIYNNKTGETDILDIEAALIRIGVEPNTEILDGAAKLDSRGYIVVDRECETSLPNLFAIGDVANPVSPTISTAAGSGATAAKRIFALLNSDLK